jgi:natural product biosynthesis luciferase-like monooxygenase protein
VTPEPRRPPGIDSPQLAELSEERRHLLELRLAERGLDLADLDAAATPVPATPGAAAAGTRPGISLIFFSADGSQRRSGAYDLLLECARFADANGFEAIWVPERHFNPFGGLYPSPVALAAAIAATTENVAIRSGSVVLPLHSPVRVAEEWAVVDNLSGGRVGMSFASGWHPDDFVLQRSNWEDRRETMFSGIETIERLWRGEAVELENGVGAPVQIRIFPRPLQDELPIWITSAKTRETWLRAAAVGANVLTALLEQSGEEVGEHVAEYRRALAEHGFDPTSRRVTLMLHTFVGNDLDQVRATVRPPMMRYLRSHMGLYEKMARSVDLDLDLDSISETDKETLAEAAFERYFGTHALFGTPRGTAQRLAELVAAGVDEVACLVDFGVADAAVIEGLEGLVSAHGMLANGS